MLVAGAAGEGLGDRGVVSRESTRRDLHRTGVARMDAEKTAVFIFGSTLVYYFDNLSPVVLTQRAASWLPTRIVAVAASPGS
jgi:hypothetical protein